jgi:lysophospholipase
MVFYPSPVKLLGTLILLLLSLNPANPLSHPSLVNLTPGNVMPAIAESHARHAVLDATLCPQATLDLKTSLEKFLELSTFDTLNNNNSNNNNNNNINNNNSNIFYSVTRPDRASTKPTILLMPGWSECLLKYHPLITTLVSRGYTVLAYDHPSQGLSGRIDDCGQVTYVQSWDCYRRACRDVLAHARAVLRLDVAGVISHSLGGCVALSHVLDDGYDDGAADGDTLKWLVACSPMIEPRLPYSPLVTSAILKAMRFLGLKHSQASLRQRKPRAPKSYHLPRHGITRNLVRLAHYEAIRRVVPEVICAVPSVSFVQAIMKGGKLLRCRLHELSKAGSKRKSTPLPRMLFLVSGNDGYVVPSSTLEFCSKLSSSVIEKKRDLSVAFYPDAYHDVLDEIDVVGKDAVGKILDFIEETEV